MPQMSHRRIVLAVVGLALLAIGCSGKSTDNASSSNNGGDAKAAAGMNQAVRDGKFEFTVTKVQCGASQIGSNDFGVKAQGQFCRVSLTVKNIGDKAQMFDGSSQHAFNAAGQKYDADTAAAIYLGDEANSFLKDINPGNSVNGTVVFDIPKDAAITKLELHDSAFSGGVTVKVS